MNFVLAFSCGRESEYATCAGAFFANGGEKIPVFKHNRIRVDGAWVRVAWNCIVGLFCEAFWPSFCATFQQPIKEAIASLKTISWCNSTQHWPSFISTRKWQTAQFFSQGLINCPKNVRWRGNEVVRPQRGGGEVTRQIHNLVINLQNTLNM